MGWQRLCRRVRGAVQAGWSWQVRNARRVLRACGRLRRATFEPAFNRLISAHLVLLRHSTAMFRATAVALGGGRHFLVPKSVFSLAGGFWGSSSAGGDEKRSSLIAVGLLASALAVTYSVSVERMVRLRGGGAQRAAR